MNRPLMGNNNSLFYIIYEQSEWEKGTMGMAIRNEIFNGGMGNFYGDNGKFQLLINYLIHHEWKF